MTNCEFVILRHGETEWNREGRFQGSLDSPLTQNGVAQAMRQRDILRELGCADWRWVSSPLKRALRTAEIARGGAVATDPRLVEIGMGDWTGRSRAELAAENPGLFEDDGLGWYDHAPRGEGLAALAVRCRAFVSGLTEPTVVITHGITSRVIRCLATNQPAEAFDTLEGGQGVVFHLRNGISTRHV